MYEDNLTELSECCDEVEDFCVICSCKAPDVEVTNNCCQRCENELLAAIEDS